METDQGINTWDAAARLKVLSLLKEQGKHTVKFPTTEQQCYQIYEINGFKQNNLDQSHMVSNIHRIKK